MTQDTVTDPLTPYSDTVTTKGTTSALGVGLGQSDSGTDPVQVHQLSQQAYDKLHPVDMTPAPTSTTTNASPADLAAINGGGGGGGDIPDFYDPSTDNVKFGTPGGGSYISDDADKAEKIVSFAHSMLGRPYIWGGTSRQGVDCSGLVQLAYAAAGIPMPRLSYDQMNRGKRVPLDKLQPGDLVGWDNTTRFPGADHIAIYIGNGQIIEAPRPGLDVRISGLYDYDVNEMWGVRVPGAAPKARIKVPSVAQVLHKTGASNRAVEAASTRAAAKPKPKSPAGPRRASID